MTRFCRDRFLHSLSSLRDYRSLVRRFLGSVFLFLPFHLVVPKGSFVSSVVSEADPDDWIAGVSELSSVAGTIIEMLEG